MSMKLRRTDLVALAREIYEGNDFEGTLARSKRSFIKKLETKLWDDLKEKYPERDYAGTMESRTRANIVKKLERILKCKSSSSIYMKFKWGFRQRPRGSRTYSGFDLH